MSNTIVRNRRQARNVACFARMSAYKEGGELAGFGHCKDVASVCRLLNFIPIRPRGLTITSNEQWGIVCRNVEYVDIKTIGILEV